MSLRSNWKKLVVPGIVIVPVGISCLASQDCSTQGPQLGQTIATFSPTADFIAPSSTTDVSYQGDSNSL